MKKYIANTAISVSVTLPHGGSARISFSPLSDGTSVYYTRDEEIEWALEHHYKFGRLFRLAETDEQNAGAGKKTTKATAKKTSGKSNKKSNSEKELPSPEEETEEVVANEDSEGEEEGAQLKEVIVSDLDSAKDYLAEHFDIVRTKLKSEEIINETAHSFGIDFKYL